MNTYTETDFFAVKPQQGSLFTDAQPLPDKAMGPLYQPKEQGKLFCVGCGEALDPMHTFVCSHACKERLRRRQAAKSAHANWFNGDR